MPTVSFEDLQVYQLAETLADDVWNIVVAWDAFARETVGKQLVKAARTALAQTSPKVQAEGAIKTIRRFIRIARGSLYETRHWLRRAYKRKLLSDEQISKLKLIIQDLSPKLNAYLRSIGKASQAPITNGPTTNDQ